MSLLRHTLEEERHEVIQADGDPYGVPTGYVPRTFGPHRLPGGESAESVPTRCVPLRTRPFTYEIEGRHEVNVDPIAQAVDHQLLVERKARAWDALVAFSKQPGATAERICDKLLALATGGTL